MHPLRITTLLALCASPAFARFRVFHRYITQYETSIETATAEVSEAVTIQYSADAVLTESGNVATATLAETTTSTVLSTEPAQYTSTIVETSTTYETSVSAVTSYVDAVSTVLATAVVEAAPETVYVTAGAVTVTAPRVYVTIGA